MTLLLNTTVLIDVLRNKKQRRELLRNLVTTGHVLATAAINVGEVYSGMQAGEEAKTESFLSGLECFPISVPIARRAGLLVGEHGRKGRTLSLADMLVAATALEHKVTLLTDNRRDFPMPEIDFYDLP